MKKYIKKVSAVILFFAVIWIIAAVSDIIMVVNQKNPLFCSNTNSCAYTGNCYNTYVGLGYSFIISEHYTTKNTEFLYSIFGHDVYNDFTNSKVTIVDSAE